jgi:glycine betaine/proline transport system permease protein
VLPRRSAAVLRSKTAPWPLIVLAAVLLLIVLLQDSVSWIKEFPAALSLPLVPWIDMAMHALIALDFGIFTFQGLTRGIASHLTVVLQWTDQLLSSGFSGILLTPVAWPLLIGLAIILGHYIDGLRLALLTGGCLLYLLVFGHWASAMKTLSLVLVCVPSSVVMGLGFGIVAAKSEGVERMIRPVLDLMQSIPQFAYFIPILFLFGIGSAAGAIAIILFAMPPMVRCATLGLRRVPQEIIEAGDMAGCSSWQRLWRVEIPVARPTLMTGVNQVIMQTLAMVVIASLIGVRGLGYDLLFSLQNLRLGLALEQGIAIVAIAIALDRLSAAYASKQPLLPGRNAPWPRQHSHVLVAAGLAVLILAAAYFVDALRIYPAGLTVSTAAHWDQAIRDFTDFFYDPLYIFRTTLLIYLLIPAKNFFLWLPWPALMLTVGFLAWRTGGIRLALMVALLMWAIAASGLWRPTMLTLYLVSIAVILSVVLGVPIGIIASRNERLSRWVLLWCDTFQTFPSFVYLIPVIMLFRAGDVAAIVAIVVWSIIPMIRYTILGLRGVSSEVVEAALVSGCSPWQLLWRVQFPLALPEIMLGFNQTIVFALFMVIIAALIGTQDLGREILQALSYTDVGRGVAAGLCIAFIGIIADRIIGAWRDRRRKALGLV